MAAEDLVTSAVALDGHTTLLGAHGASAGMLADRGAAYLFGRNQGGADS
jgi:hypothetical protein